MHIMMRLSVLDFNRISLGLNTFNINIVNIERGKLGCNLSFSLGIGLTAEDDCLIYIKHLVHILRITKRHTNYNL